MAERNLAHTVLAKHGRRVYGARQNESADSCASDKCFCQMSRICRQGGGRGLGVGAFDSYITPEV